MSIFVFYDIALAVQDMNQLLASLAVTWLSAYSQIRAEYNHLFQHPSPTVASFLATEQLNVLGSYLKTCFAHRQLVLTTPLLAWLLALVELD